MKTKDRFIKPGSPEHTAIVKRLIAELDAKYFPTEPEPRNYRTIEDANGFPMPLYNAPPIRRVSDH